MKPVLYLVVPCYNEESVLPISSKLLMEQLYSMIGEELIHPDSRILFVDDGSRDSTWSIIQQLAREDHHYTGIRQSRNRGHQNAVLAGLMEAMERCDITISIDCDGQDDVRAMREMVLAYLEGCEIVYGVRSKRDTDTVMKRATAVGYYKLLHWMGIDVVFNHSDYRLVSRRALREFARFPEANLYLRGIFPLVGFKSTCVAYERGARLAGESKYPLRKMLTLAVDGITSLSLKPIHMVTVLGVLISLAGLGGMIWSAAAQSDSLVCWLICLMGGIQLVALGVIGAYVGKTYQQVQNRPRYIISERTQEQPEQRATLGE